MNTYYMENKFSLFSGYKYNICDESGQLIFGSTERGILALLDRFIGMILAIGHRILVKTPDGHDVISIKKSWGFFRRDFDVIFMDNTHLTVREGGLLIKPKITILAQSGEFIVYGDLFAHKFTLKNEDTVVAEVKLKSKNFLKCYEITVLEDSLREVAIAITFIIDKTYQLR